MKVSAKKLPLQKIDYMIFISASLHNTLLFIFEYRNQYLCPQCRKFDIANIRSHYASKMKKTWNLKVENCFKIY